MEYLQVTKENIEKEHICCALSSNNENEILSKKTWLLEQFNNGLVFLKSKERGKCFIEYIPAENAWIPIQAEGYMYIDCLWVSGFLKGHGYSTDLLAACIKDSNNRNKNGLCILSSHKKKPYLADSKFLKYQGFDISDESDNGIQLWYLPLVDNAFAPKFKECAKHPYIDEKGFVLYYTSQCPFNAKYVPIIEEIAKKRKIRFKSIHIKSKDHAQTVPTPVTTYALFYDGNFITNEIMSDKIFIKLLEKKL